MATENGLSGPGTSAAASLGEIERAVSELWREALQTQGLPSADDDFFALGGDSMTMVLVEFRIMEEFGIQLPAGTLLGSRTIRELTAVIAGSVARAC